jgi:hypothetical protein
MAKKPEGKQLKMATDTGPTVVIDADGNPVFIDTLPAEVLRLIKPTDDDIDLVYQYKSVYNLDDPNKLRRAQEQYLSRFNLTPDNPRYADALAQLATESNSRRVAVAQARRNAQRVELIQQTGGDFSGLGVYVNDDDPCEPCEALGGLIQPITEFEANNQEPGDVCLGGDNCRCQIIAIQR